MGCSSEVACKHLLRERRPGKKFWNEWVSGHWSVGQCSVA